MARIKQLTMNIFENHVKPTVYYTAKYLLLRTKQLVKASVQRMLQCTVSVDREKGKVRGCIREKDREGEKQMKGGVETDGKRQITQ